MNVELLPIEAFLTQQRGWDDLVLDTAGPLPFMSHAWLATWWKHFGGGQEFACVVVREGDQLLAAAPLVIRRVAAGVRVAEIVGTGPVPTRGMGLSDKTDLLVRRTAAVATPALVSGLRRVLGRVHLLDLKGVQTDSAAVAELSGPPARAVGRSVSPYLPLSTWEAYLGSRSRNFRKHLKKYQRQLEAAGPLEIARFDGERDAASAWLDEVASIDALSWKAERGTNVFRHPRIRAFLSEAVVAMASMGWIDLHVMRIGARPVAFELCFDFGGRIFSYSSGYDPDYARMSPGTALTAEVIRAACQRQRREYDLLRGDEAYKSRWSELLREEHELLVPGGLLGRVYSLLGPRLKARLKRSRWLDDLDDRLSGLRTRLRRGN